MPSPSAVPTSEPVNAEVAARQAVESAWARFWVVYATAERNPPIYSAAQLGTEVAAAAVDPTRDQVLKEVAGFQAAGLSSYGTVAHRVTWPADVAGRRSVVLNDCMDQSRAGSLWVKTQAKRTVGVARDTTRGTLVRGADGSWRVQLIEYLVKVPC